jgi:hypothetical protein
MTRQEAIVEFEEFSKGGFNTFKFYAEGSIYRFPPSRSALFFLNGFYLISFIVPHLIYLFGYFSKNEEWNNGLYGAVILLSFLLIWLLSAMAAALEIIIDQVSKEVEITSKDLINKIIKKKVNIKISEIKDINEVHISTKQGGETHLWLVTQDGSKHRLFTLSNYDNVTKFKAALSTLLFNKEIAYDDSKEPSVQIDKRLKKLLYDKDGETSYFGLVVTIGLIIIMFFGLFGFLSLCSLERYSYAQIDSLALISLQCSAIAFAICLIPIYFAANTAYQKKKKTNKKTMKYFIGMAIIGISFGTPSLIKYFNYKLDASKGINTTVDVIRGYEGSTRKKYRYCSIIVLKVEGYSAEVEVRHPEPNLYKNLPPKLEVKIHEGYFKKRWLSLD